MNKRIFYKKSTLVRLLLTMVLATLIMWQGATTNVFAKSQDDILQDNSTQADSIEQSTVSIDDNFCDDSIVVTLSAKASLNFKRYKTSDFPEVKLASIIEITEDLTNKAEKQLKSNNGNHNSDQGNNGNGHRLKIDSFKRIFKLNLAEPSKEAVLEAINALKKRDDVRAAEPNYIGKFMATTNDSYASNQWAINSIYLPEAWELSTGSNKVRVGVVDSGIDRYHPDLAGRINEELSSDLSGGNNPWTETNSHGTHTAGIIGAIGNNSRGVVGTNWNVELVSLKAGDVNPTVAAVAASITHATNNGIRILNMSLWVDETAAINDAIALFDGVIIAAAGNYSNSDVRYPARLKNPKIISVGSINSDNSRSDFSCYGKVDIWAPGNNILSTWPTTLSGSESGKPGYNTKSGTSMAAPYVAGVAALMLAVNPDLTYQQISENIIESGNWIDINLGIFGLWKTSTVRKLDAYEAVKAIAIFETRIISDTSVEIRGTFGRKLSGTVTIPEILNSRSVTNIANSSFANHKDIRHIELPESITTIEVYAFANCTNLGIDGYGVYLPSHVSIDSYAFLNCNNLNNVIFSGFGTSIADYAFQGCNNLSYVELGNIINIAENAFKDCYQLIGLYNNNGHINNLTKWKIHNYIYTFDSSYQHLATCQDIACTFSIFQPHNFDQNSYCNICYYQHSTHVHDFSHPVDFGDHNYHASECWICTDIIFEPHSYRPMGSNSVVCGICGHIFYYSSRSLILSEFDLCTDYHDDLRDCTSDLIMAIVDKFNLCLVDRKITDENILQSDD